MENEKSSEMVKKPGRQLRLWIILILAISLLLLFVLLCRYEPAAYTPAAPENPQQVSPYLTHKLGPDFFNQVQLDEPFVLEVEQAGLNDIISRLEWPQPLGDAMFDDPVVIFDNGAIVLMGTLSYKGVSSVVTLQSEPLMTEDGRINLNIQSIRMGMLPVMTLVSKIANAAFEANLSQFEDWPREEAIVRAILKNEAFEPVFTVADKKVRITKFSVEPKLLTLTCEPVKENLTAPQESSAN